MSTVTGKKIKPSNCNTVCDHLFHRNFLHSFDKFSILAHENKKHLLEIKEILLIIRDKPSLNRNINSTPFYPFYKLLSFFHISLFNLVQFILNIIIKP